MNNVILILLVSLCNGLFLALGFTAACAIFLTDTVEGKHWTQKPPKLPRKLAKAQQKELQKQQETMEIMLHNIDVYNGTGEGQRNVDP